VMCCHTTVNVYGW